MPKFTITLILVNILFLKTSHSQELSSMQVYDLCKNSIVVVNAYGFDGDKESSGSGVILKEKGIIITNFHIFSGSEKLEIITDLDTLINPEIYGVDIERDILLIVLPDKDYVNIKLGDSKNVKIGEKVIAIGNPLGFQQTLTEGVLSGIREKVSDIDKKFLQISASLSKGSSGGGIFNTKGELIGISSLGMKEGQNLNFAIPIDEVFSIEKSNYTDKKKLEALNYFLKAMELLEQGKNQESIDFISKYIIEFPEDPKGYNYKGLALTGRKLYSDAIKEFDKSIKLKIDFFPAYLNRADAYYKSDNFEKCIKDYSYVIRKDPQNVYAFFARGVANLKYSEEDDAIKDFTKVIQLDKDYWQAYVNRGIAYYEEKQWELAIIDWKTAISLEPSLKPELSNWIQNADVKWQINY